MDKEKPIQKLLNRWDEAYRFALMHCARRKRWQQGAEEKRAKGGKENAIPDEPIQRATR